MNKLMTIFLIIFMCNLAIDFLKIRLSADASVGDPLILTPLIESGKVDLAKEKALVHHNETKNVKTYSGYFTVNKEFNSNLFFWFFPSEMNSEKTPVVLWIEGGPGTTSLISIFTENGPFSVTKNNTLTSRRHSWHSNHNLLYIDSPAGTGYSFTENDLGYATNQNDVSRDLLLALVQFFKLFPELRQNEFFISGESYSGKYVPSISHAIKEYNTEAKIKINLKGLAIGNGLSDPYNQFCYSDFLYQIGLLDFNGRDQFRHHENQAKNLIKQEKHHEAFEVFNKLILGVDLGDEPSLFKKLTGFSSIYNYSFLENLIMNEAKYFVEWIQKPDVRRAIHVGNITFRLQADKVFDHLKGDITKSVAFLIPDLLQHYKVLFYTGHLDVIVPYASIENMLLNLEWCGAEDYKKAPRKQWKVGGLLAGYSKTVGNLTEVMIRNAGHTASFSKPMWTHDLITRFTHHQEL